MQDCLRGGLALQDTDLASGAAGPKSATMHRVQDRELDLAKRVASFHPSSLGPRGSVAAWAQYGHGVSPIRALPTECRTAGSCGGPRATHYWREAAVAPTLAMSSAARFVQGIGGAMTSAVILGMIVTMFPESREQAKAIGVFAFVASAGGSVGLLAGGVLTQSINWHWIFFGGRRGCGRRALLARASSPALLSPKRSCGLSWRVAGGRWRLSWRASVSRR